MRRSIAIILAAVSVVAGATPVLTHHAFSAEFDANRPLELRGAITKVEWINPHAWVHLDVKKDDGTVEKWMIEGGTPNTLYRRGFTKDSLTVGLEIVVAGYQAKDRSNKANGRDLTFKDGRKLFMGSSGTGAPKDGRDTIEK